LAAYAPERVIIEPSGVGKLSDVVNAVEAVEADLHISSKSVVVDVNKCKMYLKNFGEFFLNQVENADTILLSRTGSASAEKVQQAVELLRAHNAHATIVTTPWDALDGKALFHELVHKHDLVAEVLHEVEHAHKHEHEHEHHHHHEHGEACSCGHHHADEVFVSWGMETPAVYSAEKIEAILAELSKEDVYGNVLRAKGMVDGGNGSWVYFDYVPGEAQVRTGNAAVTGKLCVIGAGLNQDALAQLFA
jgi:G3E family GTPase